MVSFRSSLILGLAVLTIGLVGCATIIRGSLQDVSVSSTPEGAEVAIYDRYDQQIASGATPYTTSLERGEQFFQGARYRVEIEHEDHEPVTTHIRSGVSGWYLAGNFFFGGLLGWVIVDPATGAMWNLRPDQIHEELPDMQADPGNPDETGKYDLHFVFTDQVSEALLDQATPITGEAQAAARK